MIRTGYILALVLCLAGCKRNDPEVVHAPEPEPVAAPAAMPEVKTAIVPGQRIGNIALEMDAGELGFLGAPDLSDSAMGKSWSTWYSANSNAESGKYELNLFTTYKDDEMKRKVVRLVRVTSPDFSFGSISTGKSINEVRESFPEAKYVGAYPYDTTKDFVELYDDRKQGIAFEFLKTESGDSCIAIIVHPENEDVTLQYRTFRPDLVLK